MSAAPVVSPPVEQRGKQAPWKNSLTTAPIDAGDPACFAVELVGIDEFLGHLHLAVFELDALLITEGSQRSGDLLGLLQALLYDHVEHLSVELLELGILQELLDIEILVEKELNVSKIYQVVRHDDFLSKKKQGSQP
jgi:hypothetical protein